MGGRKYSLSSYEGRSGTFFRDYDASLLEKMINGDIDDLARFLLNNDCKSHLNTVVSLTHYDDSQHS
jgi:hypothetical protein